MSVARSAFFLLGLLGLVLGQGGCVGRSGVAERWSAPSRVTRAEAMAVAVRYASHAWVGELRNVRHGRDGAGVQVDTPDMSYHKSGFVPGYWQPGAVSYGVPYQWGGFSSLEAFDAGLRAGRAAGDVYTEEKRALLDAGVSAEAVGIDCSGLVSRCWGLPRSFSTRELGNLCEVLGSWQDLRPGDVLNVSNGHVVLFSGWVGGEGKFLAGYETGGPPDWKVVRHVLGVRYLRSKGYQALRYRGMTEG